MMTFMPGYLRRTIPLGGDRKEWNRPQFLKHVEWNKKSQWLLEFDSFEQPGSLYKFYYPSTFISMAQ